jgi:hypothetical protein
MKGPASFEIPMANGLQHGGEVEKSTDTKGLGGSCEDEVVVAPLTRRGNLKEGY